MENALVVLSHTDHNLVGAYVQDGCERILKLTASSHRSGELIQAEGDWMDYLFGQGLAVSRPVPTRSGRLVEQVDVEGGVTAVSFVKAPGQSPTASGVATSDHLVRAMGRFLERIHVAAKGYPPRAHRGDSSGSRRPSNSPPWPSRIRSGPRWTSMRP